MDDDVPLPRAIVWDLFAALFAIGAFLAGTLAWAVWAPLTTTIKVSGEVLSERPSYVVQHSRGGRLERVFVDLFDDVAKDQVLFEFDVSREKDKRNLLKKEQALLLAEKVEIERRTRQGGLNIEPSLVPELRELYENKERVFQAKVTLTRQSTAATTAEGEAIAQELELRRGQWLVLKERIEKTAKLVERGAAPQVLLERLNNEAADAEIDMAQLQTRLGQIEEDQRMLQTRVQADRAAYFEGLLSAHQRISERLLSVQRQVMDLDYIIEGSVIRASLPGKIAQISFVRSGLVVQPGEDMAIVSQPLAEPRITLNIPVHYVDQVFVGQKGTLSITSLPQRTSVPIKITVSGIAREPVKLPDGATSHFVAEAQLDLESFDLAMAGHGGMDILVSGMPVAVNLFGSETTLWTYITTPFQSMWASSFEE